MELLAVEQNSDAQHLEWKRRNTNSHAEHNKRNKTNKQQYTLPVKVYRDHSSRNWSGYTRVITEPMLATAAPIHLDGQCETATIGNGITVVTDNNTQGVTHWLHNSLHQRTQ